ncbi:MAG: IPT/TIG domain-containing protein, partial [Chloroflexota bacterium]|nr:IPT/TIG domain-containing protein [Chloroflexota bacterium]
ITVGGQLASLDTSKPNDDTHLYVTVPATDTAGAVDVVVATEDGVATRTGGFTYRLAPTVSAVSERYGPLVSPTTVVITGANFVAGETTVHFGSVDVAGAVNADGTVVTATTTGGSGSVALSVITDGGAADAGAFTYVAPPTVDSVSPTSGPATGGTTVTLTGANFVPGETQVFFGGVAATALTGSLDHSTLTAVAPPHAVSDFTAVPITVDAPGGQTDAATTYTYAPAPTLTSMAPVTGSADGGDAITITGTGFTPDSQVLFGTTPADQVTVISSTELVATEPGGSGAVDVTVVATGGTTPVVDAGRFTYVVPGACPSVAGTGYTRTIGGWTLTSPNAPLNGSLASVTLTPPSLLHLNRSVTLHCVAIGADGAPALPLTLPTLSLSYQGFTVTANGATLDGNGLRAGLLTLALPAAVVAGNASPTLTAQDVAFSPDGAAVGTITFPDTQITLAGFTLAASGVTLTGGTLSIGTASLALPASLLPSGAAPVTISGPLSLTSGGALTGSLSATLPALNVAGFAVAAGTATLDNNGLVVSGASLTVPSVLTPPGGSPLTLRGTLRVSPSYAVTGSLAIPGAAFGLAGFAASGDIALDATGFHVDNARLTLPARLTPSGSAPITLSGGFQVTTGHKVIGSLSSGAVTLTVAGFSAAARNVTLDNSGLTVTGASLAVSDLGASVSSLALSGDLRIAPDYTVAGSVAVAPFSVQANGVGVAVNGVALGNGGLDAIASAILPAPFDTTGAVGALHVAPDHTISATLSLAVPTFRAAGLTVDAGALTASVT